MTRAGAEGLAAVGLRLGDRLRGIDVGLRAGEVTAIVGPNGAGKSSLLSCLAGIERPSAGEVRLDRASLAVMAPRERARAIGYLPQTPEIAWDMSVATLVGLGRLPWPDAPPGEARDAVDEAIAALDLGDLRDRPVTRLSGGERARALMARVLATRPAWLLADEPLANLDLAHAAALAARLRDQAAGGRGVVLVLHDLATAMNHADRVLVIERGRIVADGPPEEALAADRIAQVWQLDAQWLGPPGSRALSHR